MQDDMDRKLTTIEATNELIFNSEHIDTRVDQMHNL